MQPLRLGEVLPTGWLRRQLTLQAQGMGGHLDEFWPDVGSNSGWLGGTGESWERGPYFVDGLFPLAVLLDDTRLRAKAMRFIEWTLGSQRPDGMFGPTSNNDWWPRMVMLKAVDQYGNATGDPRADAFLSRYFHHQLAALPARPLSSWGKYRWQDEAMIAVALYRRTGDPALMDVYRLLERQGFDWVGLFRNFPYTEPQTRARLHLDNGIDAVPDGMATHGVNNGQGLKMAAVRFQAAHDAGERANFRRQLSELDRFHGMPNGMFSCDEHLAGLDPTQGTELCTVVETMFSLEVALAAFGEPEDADRLEKIAYNALPGTFTDDMWAHQYDQQPNQVRVSRNSKPWTTNGPDSNLYGLEPNFGCCTANFHQGWPKLTRHLWMRSTDGGLAAVVWAPCSVQTTVRGQAVELAVETEYPFRNTVRVHVQQAGSAAMPLHLRIPGWSTKTDVRVNGHTVDTNVQPATFLRLDRVWKAGDIVELSFEMKPTVRRGFHRSVSVERGPLVFSYSPGGTWVKLRDHPPTADWQVFPERPWNYALAIDEATVTRIKVTERPLGTTPPFALSDAGVTLQAPARRLPRWEDVDGVARTVPESPVTSTTPIEQIGLVPYAAAKLRITSFPQCDPNS